MALWAPFLCLFAYSTVLGAAIAYSKWALDLENLYLFRAKLYNNLGSDDCKPSAEFIELLDLKREHHCGGARIRSQLRWQSFTMVSIESAPI
jgi:hypothetical protein